MNLVNPEQFRHGLMWAAFWGMVASAVVLVFGLALGASWHVWGPAIIAFPLCYFIREACHDMWMDVKAPRIPSTYTTPRDSDSDWEK